MTRGRKASYINKLTSKDQNLLQAFRNVGYLSKRHVKEDIGLADKRILNFQRDGYVERCAYYNRQTKEAEHIYRLTDKGKELCSTQLNIANFYKSSSARHDLALADKYFSFRQEERMTWMTEADLRDQFHQHIEALLERGEYIRAYDLQEGLQERIISVPDGACVKGGDVISIEVVTSSYGTVELNAKEFFVQEMGFNYETIKI